MTGAAATQTLATGTTVIFIPITSTISTQPPVASTVAIQTLAASTAALIPVTSNAATTQTPASSTTVTQLPVMGGITDPESQTMPVSVALIHKRKWKQNPTHLVKEGHIKI